jgi:hypothetical protein
MDISAFPSEMKTVHHERIVMMEQTGHDMLQTIGRDLSSSFTGRTSGQW